MNYYEISFFFFYWLNRNTQQKKVRRENFLQKKKKPVWYEGSGNGFVRGKKIPKLYKIHNLIIA